MTPGASLPHGNAVRRRLRCPSTPAPAWRPLGARSAPLGARPTHRPAAAPPLGNSTALELCPAAARPPGDAAPRRFRRPATTHSGDPAARRLVPVVAFPPGGDSPCRRRRPTAVTLPGDCAQQRRRQHDFGVISACHIIGPKKKRTPYNRPKKKTHGTAAEPRKQNKLAAGSVPIIY